MIRVRHAEPKTAAAGAVLLPYPRRCSLCAQTLGGCLVFLAEIR